MVLINANPPVRPANACCASIRDLYLCFERIFLLPGRSQIVAPCGHKITVFDHHFFHLAAISIPGNERLFMRDEKKRILETTDGFGDFLVGQNGSRARHLPAVYETLSAPDEVWEDNPKAKARWVYLKEYDSLPYPFSVVLVTERPEESLIVPKTGFPCRKTDIKKWRAGKKIYP